MTRLVVLIPDGAAEPGDRTSLSRARTPHLDALGTHQGIGRLRTIPPETHPGTEVGVARLLGIPVHAVGRGWLEAAAAGVAVRDGQAAWRLDVHRGDAPPARLATTLAADVHRLADDRNVLVGPASWGDAAAGHDWPLPPAWRARIGVAERALGVRLHAWGTVARPVLPPRPDVAVVADSPAVAGLARLLGARRLPDATAAVAAIVRGDHRVVAIHDAAPDVAGHARDATAKVATIERFDAVVVGPAVAAARTVGASVLVAADHGCDPATGAHTADPVPATWPGAEGVGRCTEAAVRTAAPHDAARVVTRLLHAQEVAA